jgi:hypothetical protein
MVRLEAQVIYIYIYTMKSPYELFGWEIGKGWYPLINELIEKLINVGWDGQVFQIKEKFGGLRFYIGEGNDAIFDLIHEAENKSYKICEECGQPGVVRGGGWLKTLCDEHAGDREPIKWNNDA